MIIQRSTRRMTMTLGKLIQSRITRATTMWCKGTKKMQRSAKSNSIKASKMTIIFKTSNYKVIVTTLSSQTSRCARLASNCRSVYGLSSACSTTCSVAASVRFAFPSNRISEEWFTISDRH